MAKTRLIPLGGGLFRVVRNRRRQPISTRPVREPEPLSAVEELTQLTEEMGLYDDARRIVAKVSDKTRAEREAEARRVLAWLDKADPGVRVKFMAYTIQRQRDDAAALNYAETRLAELLDGER